MSQLSPGSLPPPAPWPSGHTQMGEGGRGTAITSPRPGSPFEEIKDDNLFLMASKYTSRMGGERAPRQRAPAGPRLSPLRQSTPATSGSRGQIKCRTNYFQDNGDHNDFGVWAEALIEFPSPGKAAFPTQQLPLGKMNSSREYFTMRVLPKHAFFSLAFFFFLMILWAHRPPGYESNETSC